MMVLAETQHTFHMNDSLKQRMLWILRPNPANAVLIRPEN